MKWFDVTIKNESDTAEVLLYDDIGQYGIEAKEFISELNNVKASNINVRINSRGGEVYDGFAIYQALKSHPATVNVTIDALAASIASVIAMAGDNITMAKNAELMIHDGHVSFAGDAQAMTQMVDSLNRVSNNIASVYAERTNGSVDEWRNAMRKETWYSAEEAVAAGLADSIAESSTRSRNVSDLTIFNYAGRAFAPAPQISAVIPSSVEETQTNIDINTEVVESLRKVLNINDED